jgi:zinc protease
MSRPSSTKSEARCGAEVHERRLANGLRILVAERHLDPVVAVMLAYRVGAADEREHEAGASHLLEHMMFKGSELFGKGEVDALTARLGGQNNAYTSYDHTAYWFEFASDRWERALEVEADRMRGLTLDPTEFAAEREVVLEELAMGEDEPWSVLGKRVEAALFQRHAYGRPIIGYADALRGMTPEGLAAYHRRFYQPANATLVVAGDVKPSRVVAAARKHFGKIAARPLPERPFAPPIEEPAGEVRLEMRWPDSSRRLCMAWPTVKVGDPDDDLLDLVLAVLVTGRRARLQRELVLDTGLATGVSAHNDTRVASGAFWLMVDVARTADRAQVEAAIDRELERLATEVLSAKELRRAVSMLVASEAHEGETVSDLAHELGGFAVDADWRIAFDAERRLARVRARDVRACVRRWLGRERRVVGWCLPEGER